MTAEEVLEMMEEEEAQETQRHIVINDERFITVPEKLKRIAVQHDHNVQTVIFDCPRFWDGLDMSKMKVYVNYLRADGVPGAYIADCVEVDETDDNIMHFAWTITENASAVKGTLEILVCIKKTDISGNMTNHWNSELNKEMYVSEGLECVETILNNYPDIVTQLLTRMDTVEAIATPEAMQGYVDKWLSEEGEEILSEIQAKGEEVLDSIPGDYQEVDSMAKEAVFGVNTLSVSKANAIQCSAQSPTITVHDSAQSPLIGLNVYGKSMQGKTTGAQLLRLIDKSMTYNGATLNVVDGIATVSGTVTGESSTLWLRGLWMSTTVLFTLEAGTYTLTDCSIWSYDGETNVSKKGTFTLAEPLNVTGIATRSYSNGETLNETLYPMLNSGNTALPWEPYTGGIASPNPDYPQEIESVGDDGSVVVSVDDQSLTLQTPNGLPGIPVGVDELANYTDSDGVKWCCDEIDLERGVYVQRIEQKTIDKINTISNSYVTYGGTATVKIDNIKTCDNAVVVLTDNALGVSYEKRSQNEKYRVYHQSPNLVQLRYPASVGEITLEQAEADFVGTKILYVLAEPIETPLSEDVLAQYKALHTNYPNTTLLNDASAEMKLTYNADTKRYIDNNYTPNEVVDELVKRLDNVEAQLAAEKA